MDLEHAKSLPELIGMLRKEGIPEKEYSWYVNRYFEFRAREKGTPISGQFELTPLCNLNCRMCYVHLSFEQMQGSNVLPVETWKDVMHQAYENGMMSATLSGGECMAYPGFDELYLYLHSLNVSTTVYTNGILLDEERIEFFKKYKPAYLQVTMYGNSEDEYENVTGHRVFQKVWTHIQKAHETGLPLKVAITPNRLMKDIKGLIARLHAADIPFFLNACLFEPREETGRTAQNLDLTTEEYVELYRYRKELLGSEPMPVDPKELPEPGSDSVKERRGTRCGAGRSFFEIDWRGRMHACSNLPDLHTELNDKDFRKAWEEIHVRATNYILPAECEDCSYKRGCMTCPAVHLHAEKGHADERVCRRARMMVEAGIFRLNENE